ncbi:PREDICTED: hemicentin-1-like [Acropora digitifera]|uniref:hemicentin-1-like n=1 Tax=Acropora digitifera TaxID=70779 RepID=UPI00077AC984|nr:PREDICTED: hemicentin-1-like [Acropora digitifera]
MSCPVMLNGKRVNFNVIVIPMNCYFFQQLDERYGFDSSNITSLSGETVIIIEGGNVTLECRAEGNPKPNITWARLPDNFNVAMPLTNITEQDAGMYYSCPRTQSCTLPLTNIIRNEAGMFRCTADNGVGNSSTGDVVLVVQFEPENAFLSTNLSTVPVVCVGMVANFTCTVEASNPAVDTFILYENGSMVSSKTALGVWIKTVDTCGEVTYKCQANNSVGTSSSSSISFTIGVRASAAVESNSIVVTEGQDVNLVCSESGFPSPSTFWVNVSNVVMDNGRILSLYNISRTMAGQYTCSARNSCGNDSQKVNLVVQYPPEVNGSGRNASVAGGAEHTFSCPVDGNPFPSIIWYKVSVSREAYKGKQFKTRQPGCYICVARNNYGISDNVTQCLFINSSLPTVAPNTGQSQTMVSSITVSQNTSQIMVSSTTASQGK